MARPNQWVDFIRKWAKDNDTTYSCALSNPKCKDAYRAKYGIKKAVPAKTERERMGLEDVNVAKKKAKKVKKKKKLLIIEDDLERAERESMGVEDVNRAELKPIRVKKIKIDGVTYLVDKATGTQFFSFKTQDPIEDPRKAKERKERERTERESMGLEDIKPKPKKKRKPKPKPKKKDDFELEREARESMGLEDVNIKKDEPTQQEFKDLFDILYRNATILTRYEDPLVAFRKAYKMDYLTKSQEDDVINREGRTGSGQLHWMWSGYAPEWLRQHIIDLWKKGERGEPIRERVFFSVSDGGWQYRL
jgi:hypothetical protein